MIDFAGQVVVVTGAGRGLGRLYALELARRGAAVVVNDVGGTVHGHGADPSVADRVVDEIVRGDGVAVASHASVATSASPFRAMKAQGYGRFVFIASSAGLFGQPLSAHYAAAKAGLVGLTNVIAIEGAPHGILANTVLPFGFSRMVTETVPDPAYLEKSGFLNAIQPELVVPLVVFLASGACDFSHRNYSACAGRFARVFVGLGEGWLAEADSEPTAEEIAAHLEEVSATEPFTVPMSIVDEVLRMCQRLGVAP
jgi:NAD(P)-dependent dehydrogenase (short-subunit alcohol dehydrogenase family)